MHSKGPWTIEQGQWQGDDEFDVMSSDAPPELLAVNVSRADAALIAAAPEMLSALEAILEIYGEPCRYDHHGLCQTHHLRRNDAGHPECEISLVRAAIDKAKGE